MLTVTNVLKTTEQQALINRPKPSTDTIPRFVVGNIPIKIKLMSKIVAEFFSFFLLIFKNRSWRL